MEAATNWTRINQMTAPTETRDVWAAPSPQGETDDNPIPAPRTASIRVNAPMVKAPANTAGHDTPAAEVSSLGEMSKLCPDIATLVLAIVCLLWLRAIQARADFRLFLLLWFGVRFTALHTTG